MADLANNGILQKAVIAILNEKPEEIKVSDADAKNFPGISTKNLDSKTANALNSGSASAFSDSGKETVRFVVQFNPSELQISAEGEEESRSYVSDAAGTGKNIETHQLSSRTRVNFALIFDDTDQEDTKEYTVRREVEGFLAALRSEYTRRVQFIWGKLSYIGILNTIQAEYTMFDPKGEPVRAEVRVGILCMDK